MLPWRGQERTMRTSFGNSSTSKLSPFPCESLTTISVAPDSFAARTSASKEPAHIRTSQTHGLNAGEGESIKFAPRKLRETPGQLRLRRESYSRECGPYLPRDEHTRPPASSPREYPAAALAQTRCDRAF